MQIIRRKKIGKNEQRTMNKNRNGYSVSVKVISRGPDDTYNVERPKEFFFLTQEIKIVLILLERNICLHRHQQHNQQMLRYLMYTALYPFMNK